MTDPTVFYNREDLWTVATEALGENGEQATQAMDPNFVRMKLPEEQDVESIAFCRLRRRTGTT